MTCCTLRSSKGFPFIAYADSTAPTTLKAQHPPHYLKIETNYYLLSMFKPSLPTFFNITSYEISGQNLEAYKNINAHPLNFQIGKKKRKINSLLSIKIQ